MADIISMFPKPPTKIIKFPVRNRQPPPDLAAPPLVDNVQDQITDLMWNQQFLTEEIVAINRTLLQLVRLLKEYS